MRNDIFNVVEEEFENANYRTAVSKGTFDIVAAGQNPMVVKILSNIDSITENHAAALSAAASSLDSIPMIVGMKTRKGLIEDSVYNRFGVPAVSVESLNLIINDRAYLSHVDRGGAVVYIDGQKMKERRRFLGLSLGNVSREVGVSKRSIVEYENGGRARPEVAIRIENVLGTSLIKNNLHATSKEGRKERLKGLEAFVSRKLRTIGFDTKEIPRSIFNLSARRNDVIIANVSENTRNFEKNAVMLHKIAEVTGKRAVFVFKTFSRRNLEGVPVITKQELGMVKELEDFEEIVEEKSK